MQTTTRSSFGVPPVQNRTKPKCMLIGSNKKLQRKIALTVSIFDHCMLVKRDKTKCMLIGSNKKLQRKIALTVSIFDHCLNNVTCFKYLGILISSDFSWTNHVEYMAGKVNQRLGLLRRIKHLLPFKACILFYKSLVMPLFEYADLVWGDKHNVTLMSSLQVLQNKAAKIILDQPLYSSASDALTTLKWLTLEKRRFHFFALPTTRTDAQLLVIRGLPSLCLRHVLGETRCPIECPST